MLTVISRHFKENSLRYTVYHGSQRHKDSKLLSSFDVVLTTYDTIRAEHIRTGASDKQESMTHSIFWHRVVLDEGE